MLSLRYFSIRYWMRFSFFYCHSAIEARKLFFRLLYAHSFSRS